MVNVYVVKIKHPCICFLVVLLHVGALNAHDTQVRKPAKSFGCVEE